MCVSPKHRIRIPFPLDVAAVENTRHVRTARITCILLAYSVRFTQQIVQTTDTPAGAISNTWRDDANHEYLVTSIDLILYFVFERDTSFLFQFVVFATDGSNISHGHLFSASIYLPRYVDDSFSHPFFYCFQFVCFAAICNRAPSKVYGFWSSRTCHLDRLYWLPQQHANVVFSISIFFSSFWKLALDTATIYVNGIHFVHCSQDEYRQTIRRVDLRLKRDHKLRVLDHMYWMENWLRKKHVCHLLIL